MEVRGIRWLGVGTTEPVAEMHALAIDVLGLRVAGEESDDPSSLRWPTVQNWSCSETLLAADDPWLFDTNPVVAGLLVDDIQGARDEFSRTPGSTCSATCAYYLTATLGSTKSEESYLQYF